MSRLRWARVGHVRKAHGLRGRLALRVYTTDSAQPVEAGTPVLIGDGEYVLSRCRATAPDALLVDIEGVRNRTDAEALVGQPVSLPLSVLMESGFGLPLPELVGMRLLAPGLEEGEGSTVTGFVPVRGNPLITVGSGSSQIDVPLGLLADGGVDWKAGTLTVLLPEGLREALGR